MRERAIELVAGDRSSLVYPRPHRRQIKLAGTAAAARPGRESEFAFAARANSLDLSGAEFPASVDDRLISILIAFSRGLTPPPCANVCLQPA